MTPSPSPSPISASTVSDTLNAVTAVATALGDALNIPSIPTSVIYIVAILLGLVGVFFVQKFVSGWLNEAGTPGNQTSASDGKSQTSTSASSTQNQTNQLPKD